MHSKHLRANISTTTAISVGQKKGKPGEIFSLLAAGLDRIKYSYILFIINYYLIHLSTVVYIVMATRAAPAYRHPVMTELQGVLSLAHSPADRQRAAIKLSEISQAHHTTLFRRDASTFPPVAHAISAFLESGDKLVVAYAARALKMIVSAGDDAFICQVIGTGLPGVVLRTCQSWGGNVEVLRELLPIVQNIAYGGSSPKGSTSDNTHFNNDQGIKALVESEHFDTIKNLMTKKDREIQILSVACAANIFFFASNESLMPSSIIVEWIPVLAKCASSRIRVVCAHAVAALANAAITRGFDPAVRDAMDVFGIPDIFRRRMSTHACKVNASDPLSVMPAAARAGYSHLCQNKESVNRAEELVISISTSGNDIGGVSPRLFRFKWGNTNVKTSVDSSPLRLLLFDSQWKVLLCIMGAAILACGLIATWRFEPSRAQVMSR